MSVVSTGTSTGTAERRAVSVQRMPFIMQVWMLAVRALIVNFRTPAAILPPLILGGFFLVIYEGQLGGASGFIPGIGGSYINFILPLSIISSSLSGAGVAGQSLVRDIESGYFDKLSLTPISRGALVLGPTIAGAFILALQASFIVFVGTLLGFSPETGIAGSFAIIGLAMLLGLGFAGFTIGLALFTGSSAATQSGSFLFFPLTFLTATFVPIDLLEGWLQTAATLNPITYILDAMRVIANDGWVLETILGGIAACFVLGAITFAFSMYALRVRTSRK